MWLCPRVPAFEGRHGELGRCRSSPSGKLTAVVEKEEDGEEGDRYDEKLESRGGSVASQIVRSLKTFTVCFRVDVQSQAHFVKQTSLQAEQELRTGCTRTLFTFHAVYMQRQTGRYKPRRLPAIARYSASVG